MQELVKVQKFKLAAGKRRLRNWIWSKLWNFVLEHRQVNVQETKVAPKLSAAEDEEDGNISEHDDNGNIDEEKEAAETAKAAAEQAAKVAAEEEAAEWSDWDASAGTPAAVLWYVDDSPAPFSSMHHGVSDSTASRAVERALHQLAVQRTQPADAGAGADGATAKREQKGDADVTTAAKYEQQGAKEVTTSEWDNSEEEAPSEPSKPPAEDEAVAVADDEAAADVYGSPAWAEARRGQWRIVGRRTLMRVRAERKVVISLALKLS